MTTASDRNWKVWRVALMATTANLLLISASPLFADRFTYVDEAGAKVETEARLAGSGQGFEALERWDGQIQIVPTGAVVNREATGDPDPIDCDGIAARLRERFGDDLTRIEIKRPFVVALVLSAPLSPSMESRAQAFTKRSVRFMSTVDDVFLKYARSMRFPIRDLRYPLVLVVFESDDDFEAYADEATGGQGLLARSILGFYSSLTNWLAVRLSSCDSFDVPLHEAVHQQVYNRVFSRLAPIPKWFDEGIAAGFEGSGEQINVNPAKVNSRYGGLATRLSTTLDWQNIVASDDSFTADVLAGDAYTLSWSLHWLLATQYKDRYASYVRALSERAPLEVMEASDQRISDFESRFGVGIAQLHQEFPNRLRSSARRQRVSLEAPPPAGRASRQQALGEFDIQAVRRSDAGGRLQAGGVIKNISPLRTMMFYVTLETENGVYVDWLTSGLKPQQQQTLESKFASQLIPGMHSGPADSFRIWVRSTASDSPLAERWRNGEVPGPVAAQE